MRLLSLLLLILAVHAGTVDRSTMKTREDYSTHRVPERHDGNNGADGAARTYGFLDTVEMGISIDSLRFCSFSAPRIIENKDSYSTTTPEPITVAKGAF